MTADQRAAIRAAVDREVRQQLDRTPGVKHGDTHNPEWRTAEYDFGVSVSNGHPMRIHGVPPGVYLGETRRIA